MPEFPYRAPAWLPGGNLQTIWPALYSKRYRTQAPKYQRDRWNTPDGDFVDIDWLQADQANPGETSLSPKNAVRSQMQGAPKAPALLVLFHGLEGSSASHYAQAFADTAQQAAMAYAVAHFRGCSGEINRAPRAYHSGDFEEIGWILAKFRRQWQGPIFAVGVSLGGNALLRWAEEAGTEARQSVSAVAAVSSPLDLAAGGWAIGHGFNRLVYTRMFLNTMKPKALTKLAQFPGLFDRDALLAAKDLYAFDNVFTAPVHGFKNTDDYWARASAKPHLARIQIPALVLNACNDPFVPAWSLPTRQEAGPHLCLWQPEQGGHVGFAMGPVPGHLRSMPEAVCHWFGKHLAH